MGMGSEGSLRHLQSSSTTESVSSNHQKERLERSSLVDGHSSSHYSKLAECKRPRVSAIRDFPPGCGRSVHLRSSFGTSGVTRDQHHVTAVRDFPPQCGRNASLEAWNFDQVQSDKVEKSLPSSNTAKTNVQKPEGVPGVKNLYDSWRRGKVAHRSTPTEGSITIKKQPERNLQPAKRPESKKSNNNGKTTRFGDVAGLHDKNTSLIRNKVTETLCRFKALCIEVERKKSREGGTSTRRIDYEAARVLKKEGGYVNPGKQIMGDVPGVEIGDKFRYRVELTIVGLHRQTEGGIDYAYFGGEALATSIVASGGYADVLHDLNSFTYTGHGGNVTHQRLPEHQELKRGNLAMKNSLDAKSPVRVICCRDPSGARDKRYMYVGLYLVEDLWQEMGAYSKFVYKFLLRRIEGQRSISW